MSQTRFATKRDRSLYSLPRSFIFSMISLIFGMFFVYWCQLYTKMSLTQAQIAHLAKLTALSPQANLEISSVLDSFDSLSRTDTSDVGDISRSGM